MPAQQRKKIGRPCTLGKGAVYFTVKLRADQLRAVNRLGGYVPGQGPVVLRHLLDLGIKVAKARAR